MVRSEDRPTFDVLVEEAAVAVRERDWAAALRLCCVAQRLDPESQVVRALRSICEERLGRGVPASALPTGPSSVAPGPDAALSRSPGSPSASLRRRPVDQPSDQSPIPIRDAGEALDPSELLPHEHSHALEDVIASVASVAPFSPLVMRLISVLDDEFASADDVARLASMDPVLTARILETANSAYYRRRIRVATIKDAVMVLGAGEVRSLVIGVCVVGAMPPAQYLDHHEFWRFSMAVALLADLIARSAGDRSGETFTAGILHNVGLLVLDRYCPQGLREVPALTAPGCRRLQDRELLVFGFTDAEIGAALAQRWHLPPTVVHAIRMNGSRSDEVEQNRVAAALIRARMFARAQGMSDGLESSAPREPGLGFLPARVQARLNAIGRWEDFLHIINGLLTGAQETGQGAQRPA